jgi:uncharacterized membrane protein (UPF0127 family)
MTNLGVGAYRFKNLPRQKWGQLELPVATTPLSRLLGLALLRIEQAWPGLLIPGCRSVHSFGMRFPLDVHFLDREGQTIQTVEHLPPRRFCYCRSAYSVVELVPGVLA